MKESQEDVEKREEQFFLKLDNYGVYWYLNYKEHVNLVNCLRICEKKKEANCLVGILLLVSLYGRRWSWIARYREFTVSRWRKRSKKWFKKWKTKIKSQQTAKRYWLLHQVYAIPVLVLVFFSNVTVGVCTAQPVLQLANGLQLVTSYISCTALEMEIHDIILLWQKLLLW